MVQSSGRSNLDTVLPTDRYPCNIFFERNCVAGRRNDTEMGSANSVHALAQCSEYNHNQCQYLFTKNATIRSGRQGMVWNGMERKFRYGIWNMPEWNGRFQEWNGRQSSILPYQFHSRFCALHLQKNTGRPTDVG